VAGQRRRLEIAADFYNFNMQQHDGRLEAVLFGKMLSEDEQKCLVRDIRARRGQQNRVATVETDTCIGNLALRPLAYRPKIVKTAQDSHSNICATSSAKTRFATQHLRARHGID